MRAGARPSQAVELEGVCERAVGERRRRRLHRRAAAEDTALAAGAGALGIVDDDAAPWQRTTTDDRPDRVADALLRLPYDRRGQILVTQRSGVFGEPDGFVRHLCSPKSPSRLLRRYAPRNDVTLLSLRAKRSNLGNAGWRRVKPWKASGAKSST